MVALILDEVLSKDGAVDVGAVILCARDSVCWKSQLLIEPAHDCFSELFSIPRMRAAGIGGESSEQVQRLVVVDLPGTLPLETPAWSPAERIACLLHLAVADIVEAHALREPVPEKAIGVLVGAPLPWMVGMAEAGRRSQRLLEALCIRELLALPGATVWT